MTSPPGLDVDALVQAEADRLDAIDAAEGAWCFICGDETSCPTPKDCGLKAKD